MEPVSAVKQNAILGYGYWGFQPVRLDVLDKIGKLLCLLSWDSGRRSDQPRNHRASPLLAPIPFGVARGKAAVQGVPGFDDA
jgi:hypothetical protein